MSLHDDARGTNRTALVTGATGGMGHAIAVRLARDGFGVGIAYSGHKSAAVAVVDEITGEGGRAASFRADISDEHEARTLFEAVDEVLGGLDVVVHTAGINRAAPLADLDLADFDAIHRVNVRGTFVVNQQAARRLRAGGSIINISSTVVRLSPPGLSAYTASKATVDVLTRILAKELRGRDITVNAVSPGPTTTGSFLATTPDEEQHQLAGLSPLGRLGHPDDIAGVVAFLASPAGRWINGQVIHANGGAI